MPDITIATLAASPATIAALADILIEAVAGGASVTFMHPLSIETARAFWSHSLACAERDERVVLGAFDGDVLAGTVTLLTAMPENQQHRAEISKLITRDRYRGRGIATSLMHAAESAALAQGRTLLVLDTAEDGGAPALYERLGFTHLGMIPDYALKPFGGFTGAIFYWKRLAGPA